MSSKHCNKQTVFSEMWSFYWYLTFVTWQVSLFARLTGCLCCQWAALLSVGVLAMRPGCICLMSIWLGDPLLQTPTDTNLQHLLPLEHACLCFWLPAVLCRPRPAQQCNYIHFLSSPLLSSPLLSSPLLSSPLLSSPLLSSLPHWSDKLDRFNWKSEEGTLVVSLLI